MRVQFEHIPADLAAAPQWVLWRYEEREGKKTKPPFQPDGRHASHSDPGTWHRLETVTAAYRKGGFEGVGFVLSEPDPLAGVDLDHCIDPETGEIAEWAAEVISSLDSYTEISPSGTGVRVFLRGALPAGAPKGGRKLGGLGPDGSGAIELYCRLRYLTVTGWRLADAPTGIEPRQEQFEALYERLFGVPETEEKPERTSAASAAVDVSDHELKVKMLQSVHGREIDALWGGHTEAYAGDDSRADAALLAHLLWWTGGDEARVDRMFRTSGLYREKWERDDYRKWTFDLARQGVGEGYSPSLVFSVEDSPNGANGANGHAPADLAAAELGAARAVLETLAEQLKADPGAVYAPEVLRALSLLRARDPGGYERARGIVKKSGVQLRPLEKSLLPVSTFIRDLPGPNGSLPCAGDTLPDCPAPTLRVPKPYSLLPDGVLAPQLADNEQPEQVVFAFAPILVTARLRDVEEGTESLRIAWQRPGLGWQDRIVDRGAALDPRKLTELASDGFPVAGDNAKQLARYLHRFEAVNYNQLRSARVSSHLGWQGTGGEAGFLWGRRLLTPAGELTGALNLDEMPADDWREDWISFRGAAAGDEQIADGYHARGDLDSYIRVVTLLKDYPRVLLAFYAAFVPPLLSILSAPNPILDWANRTSTGKTIALRVAASVWGKPDERAADGALGTWDSTRVWLERASYVLSALPLILDDTKRAKEPKMVADLLYTVASGRGRGRGNTRSLARTRTWRTALLSSGEAPATSYTQDGGTRARVLEIRGVPFGKDDPATRLVVDGLNLRLQTQYGTAGPEFIRWLYRNRHRWEEFETEYRVSVESYAERAASSVAGRMAHYAATVDLAAALVHAALSLPWSYRDPLEMLWAGIVDEASDASGEIRALRDVVSWAYASSSRFYGRHHETSMDGRPKEPSNGWAGAWERGAGWDYIAFMPTVLDESLRRFGYEPEAVKAGWKERGWLETEGGSQGNRYTRKEPMPDDRPRQVVIRRAAIEEADA